MKLISLLVMCFLSLINYWARDCELDITELQVGGGVFLYDNIIVIHHGWANSMY